MEIEFLNSLGSHFDPVGKRIIKYGFGFSNGLGSTKMANIAHKKLRIPN